MPADTRYGRYRPLRPSDESLYVAFAYLVLTAPQALDFFRLLPVVSLLGLGAAQWSWRRSTPWLSLKVPITATVLIVWLWMTSLWSDNYAITLVQSASTTLVVLVGVFAGLITRSRDMLIGVLLGGVAVLTLSLLVTLFSPGTGLTAGSDHAGTLQGLYVHRNLLAEAISPSIVAAIILAMFPATNRARFWLAALFLVLGLALTQSSTAIVGVVVGFAVVLLARSVRRVRGSWRLTPLVIGFSILAAMGVVLALNPNLGLAVLGRDSTFSGRAIIWMAVQRLIVLQPVGGYGWGAPWIPGSPVYSFVQTSVKFDVPSAHSGYLDALLQTGIIGLILFTMLVTAQLIRGIVGLLRRDSELDAWLLALSSLLLAYNIAESTFISPLSIFLLVAAGGASARITPIVREASVVPARVQARGSWR